LKGNIARYNEAIGEAFITNKALAIDYSSQDSLFLHADSLFYLKDSIYNNMKAYHGVRFFRSDLQGKCDSIFYSSRDSILTMFFEPVLWSENNQLTGDLIQIFIKDGAVDFIHVQGNAMAVMQDIDTLRFSQLVGRELRAFVVDGELRKVEVNGNTQSIYFPREDDGTLVGINRTESSFMTVHLQNNKVHKVVLYPGASGKMMPDEGLVHEDIFFPQFAWHNEIRPQRKEDVFIRTAPPVRDNTDRRRRRR